MLKVSLIDRTAWFTRLVSIQNITKHKFAFKNVEEGKSSEELDKNSDGNDPESDGDTDIDNDDHMNTDENHFICYQDDITSAMQNLSRACVFCSELQS